MTKETDICVQENVKKSVFKKYFEEQEKYSKIYGEKTIVFFEMENSMMHIVRIIKVTLN